MQGVKLRRLNTKIESEAPSTTNIYYLEDNCRITALLYVDF